MKTRNVLAAVCAFSLVLGGTTPASAHVDVRPNGPECRALKTQFQRGQQLDISRFTFAGDHNTGIRNNTLYLYDTTGHRADIEYAANLWVKAVRDRGGYLDIKFIDHKTPEAVSVLVDPSLPVLGRVTGAGPSLTVRISPQMFASTVGAKSRIMTIAHEMGHAMALAHSCDDLLMVSGNSRKPGLTPQPLDAEILILRNNLRQKPTPTPSPSPSPLPPLVTTTTSTTSERPKPTPTTSSSSSSSSQPSFPDLPPLPIPTIPSAQPLPTTTVTSTSPTTSVPPTTSKTPTSKPSTSKPSTSKASPTSSQAPSTDYIVAPEYVAPPKPSTVEEGERIVADAEATLQKAEQAEKNAPSVKDRILAKLHVDNAKRALAEAKDNLEKLREQLASATPTTTSTTPVTPTASATSSSSTTSTSSSPTSSTTSTVAPVTTTSTTSTQASSSTTSAPRTTTSVAPSVSATPTTSAAPTTSTTSSPRTTPTVVTSTSAETSTSSPACCPNCGATTPQYEAPSYTPAVKPKSVEEARAALAAAKREHKAAEESMKIVRRTGYQPLVDDAQAELDRTFFRVNEAQKNLDELLVKEPTPSSSTGLTTSPSSTTPTTSETPTSTEASSEPTSTSEEPSASASTSVSASVEPSAKSTTRTPETTSVAPSTTSVEPSTSVSVEVTTPTAASTTSEPSAEPSTSEAPEPKPEPSVPRTPETTSAAPTTTSVSVEATTTEVTTTTQSTTDSATTTQSATRTTEQTSEPEVETSTSELTPEPTVGAPATCAKDGSSSGSSENCEGSSKGGIIAAIVVPLLALLGAAAFWAKDHLKF